VEFGLLSMAQKKTASRQGELRKASKVCFGQGGISEYPERRARNNDPHRPRLEGKTLVQVAKERLF